MISGGDGAEKESAFASHISIAENLPIEYRTLLRSIRNSVVYLDDGIISLDSTLRIRSFTSIAVDLFTIIPGDVGRPLSDLRSLTDDVDLLTDAQCVLNSGAPASKNVSTEDDRWFLRSIFQSKTKEDEEIGIILSYVEITQYRKLQTELENTKSLAHRIGIENKRHLAILNHDLRQPLQSLTLILEKLQKQVSSLEALRLLNQTNAMIESISEQLNAARDSDREIKPRTEQVSEVDTIDLSVELYQHYNDNDLQSSDPIRGNGIILLIEDDNESRIMLIDALQLGGFYVVAAACAASALIIVDQGVIQPDAILTDYSLAGDVNGLALGTEIRKRLRRDVPLVVLTGDVSSEAAEALYASDCTHLTKPLHSVDILQSLARVTSEDGSKTISRSGRHEAAITICIVDDEVHARESIQELLEGEGYVVITFPDAEAFLAADLDHLNFCLLLDLMLPGLSGIELLNKMQSDDVLPTTIVLTAVQEPQEAVRAIRAGAIDFLIKPVRRHSLLAGIDRVVAHMVSGENPTLLKRRARELIGQLTERQLQVMSLILAGLPNKIIAADLGVSQRTVENHRAAIMRRTGTRSLPELAKLSIAAGVTRST